MRTLSEILNGEDLNSFLIRCYLSPAVWCEQVIGFQLTDFHRDWLNLVQNNKRVAIMSFTGSGKCLQKGTRVIMFDGSIKAVEDVVVGDRLMGDDSQPRRVLALGKGVEEMYTLKPIKGEPFTFNKSHILSLKRTNTSTRKDGEIIDIPVVDYLNSDKSLKHIYKGYRVAIDFPNKETLFDPYMLGLWLGDGNSDCFRITNPDIEIRDYLNEFCNKKSYTLKVYLDKRNNLPSFTITPLNPLLKQERLYKNKHIPHNYKVNSRENRLKLLAGLLDTDGYCCRNCYEIITKYKTLNDDILFLARSLGFAAYSSIKIGSIKSTGFKGEYYRIGISGDTNLIPCLIKRKICSKRMQKKNVLLFGFTVKEAGVGEYYGFTIDGNGRFLLSDFTVTHNTSILGNAYCLWLAWFKKGTKILIVSKTLPQSTKILNEIKNTIEDNELLKDLIPKDKPENQWCSQTTMETSTGGLIMCRPYSENIKGYHVNYVLGDEVASYSDYSIWYRFVVTRANALNGTVVAISTPEDIADLMQELINNREYVSMVCPADREGIPTWPEHFSKEKLGSIKREIGDAAYEREYLCNPRAMADNAIFPPDKVVECFDYGTGFTGKDIGGGLVMIGADFAIAAGPNADFDAYVVVEKLGGKTYIRHGEVHKGFSIDSKVKRLVLLYHQFRANKIILDPSQVGHAVIEELRKENIPLEAADFSAPNRNRMLINLRRMIDDNSLVIPRDKEDVMAMTFTNKLVHELISFRETKTKTGIITYQSKSKHDDTVAALILACKGTYEQKEFIDW